MSRNLPRRSALKGLVNGAAVSVALPFLDCFLNGNGTALAAGGPLPVRFGTWFWGLGFNPGRGVAPKTGKGIEFLEECQALVPYKDHINIFSNFNTPLDGKVTTVHFTGWVGCRTGSVPATGGDIPAPTIDVLIADEIAKSTRFRSLELSATGNPRDSYTARNTGSRNAAEVSPVAFYARVFGPEFADPNSATFTPDPQVMVRSSVLSAVSDERKKFVSTLGAADRARMDEYFTAIRQIEQRLALEMQKPPPLEACVRPSKPRENQLGTALEDVLVNHKIMSELLAMAVACNQTRVFNMLYSQALSTLHRRGEAFIHHTLTHEEPPDPELGYQIEVAWYNLRSFEALATFIEAFASIKEGDGTLLDNTIIYANSDTNYAKLHALDGIPVMTIGKGGGALNTGYHINGNGDPISRIGLTVQQAMGLQIQKWGSLSMETSKPVSEILA
ncbi:MAG: DUF1552 domain-containing protein [Rhodobacteraceae bacterium]|nr:DUF1552 domain-containing protein [Paracoccaceae bacterium]